MMCHCVALKIVNFAHAQTTCSFQHLSSLHCDTTEYEAATSSFAHAQRVVFLIKEGTASKHAKGSHSNKGQIGVYKKSIICFECCRAPKLPSTQQAFMRLQYVFTLSVGLCAVLDWFLIVATIVMMWSATVHC